MMDLFTFILNNWLWISYWIITLIALVGVIINIKHDQRCFSIWAFTNAAFAIRTYWLGAYEMTLLFSIYWVLAIIGLYAWRKHPHQSLAEENRELKIQNEYMRRAVLSAETQPIKKGDD